MSIALELGKTYTEVLEMKDIDFDMYVTYFNEYLTTRDRQDVYALSILRILWAQAGLKPKDFKPKDWLPWWGK